VPVAVRPFGDSLADASRCIAEVIITHRHNCNHYPECEMCIVMETERSNALSALKWLLTHVKER